MYGESISTNSEAVPMKFPSILVSNHDMSLQTMDLKKRICIRKICSDAVKFNKKTDNVEIRNWSNVNVAQPNPQAIESSSSARRLSSEDAFTL